MLKIDERIYLSVVFDVSLKARIQYSKKNDMKNVFHY